MNTYFFVLTATIGHGAQRLTRTLAGELVAGHGDTQSSLYEKAVGMWSLKCGRGSIDGSFTVEYWTLTSNTLPA